MNNPDLENFTFSTITPHMLISAKYFAGEAERLEQILGAENSTHTGQSRSKESKAVEKQHLATTLGAVMCSYSYIEAVVNSTIHQIAMDHKWGSLAIDRVVSERVYKELEHAYSPSGKGLFTTSDIFTKIERLLTLFLSKPSMDKTSVTHLKALTLRNFRHSLLHPAPEWVHNGTSQKNTSHNFAKNEKLKKNSKTLRFFL